MAQSRSNGGGINSLTTVLMLMSTKPFGAVVTCVIAWLLSHQQQWELMVVPLSATLSISTIVKKACQPQQLQVVILGFGTSLSSYLIDLTLCEARFFVAWEHPGYAHFSLVILVVFNISCMDAVQETRDFLVNDHLLHGIEDCYIFFVFNMAIAEVMRMFREGSKTAHSNLVGNDKFCHQLKKALDEAV